MITVASFDNVEQAELLRIRLENEGIPAYVADAAVVTLNWLYSNAVSGVKVQVDEADVDRVRAFLREERAADSEGEPLSEHTCPFCGSTKVEDSRISKRFFMLSLLLLGFPLAFHRAECHCLDCCRTWRNE